MITSGTTELPYQFALSGFIPVCSCFQFELNLEGEISIAMDIKVYGKVGSVESFEGLVV